MEQFFGGLPIWMNLIMFSAGLVAIVKGADWFVSSAVAIAEATHVPKIVIGATIVSVATTFPEFSVSFMASLMDRPQTAVGNSVGSAICNIGLVLATSILVRGIATQRGMTLEQGAFMVIAGIGVAIFSVDGCLARLDGLVLLIGLGCYIWYSLRAAGSERGEVQMGLQHINSISESFNLSREVLWFVIGAFSVGLGSVLLVQNAAILARWLGISELIIALTLVAVGTSLPEYVTSLTAIVKGHGDLSVGNIFGANILDIFWVLGASSFVRSLPIHRQTQILDLPFMLALMVLLVIFSATRQKLQRWEGGILFGGYVIYLLIMFSFFA